MDENIDEGYTFAGPERIFELAHRFWVRPDYEAFLVVPEDLTREEAKRLGEMISTLGREDWE